MMRREIYCQRNHCSIIYLYLKLQYVSPLIHVIFTAIWLNFIYSVTLLNIQKLNHCLGRTSDMLF